MSGVVRPIFRRGRQGWNWYLLDLGIFVSKGHTTSKYAAKREASVARSKYYASMKASSPMKKNA